MAVDHELVALADRARLQQRRIRPGGVRLGHRERRADVAGQQRLEPALLLLGRAGEREDLRVPRVRRGVAERQRRDDARAEDLVQQAELDLAVALPAELGRQVGGPQAAGADLVLERLDRPLEAVHVELAAEEQRLDRPQPLADEAVRPLQLRRVLRVRREVPAHVRLPLDSLPTSSGIGGASVRRVRPVAARRHVPRPRDELYALLADLRSHWQLAGRWVQPLALRADGGVVRVRGPLGLRADDQDHADRDAAARGGRRRGRDRVHPRRRPLAAGAPTARARWSRCAPTCVAAGPVDRALLALGGRRWMRARFAATLKRLG